MEAPLATADSYGCEGHVRSLARIPCDKRAWMLSSISLRIVMLIWDAAYTHVSGRSLRKCKRIPPRLDANTAETATEG